MCIYKLLLYKRTKVEFTKVHQVIIATLLLAIDLTDRCFAPMNHLVMKFLETGLWCQT